MSTILGQDTWKHRKTCSYEWMNEACCIKCFECCARIETHYISVSPFTKDVYQNYFNRSTILLLPFNQITHCLKSFLYQHLISVHSKNSFQFTIMTPEYQHEQLLYEFQTRGSKARVDPWLPPVGLVTFFLFLFFTKTKTQTKIFLVPKSKIQQTQHINPQKKPNNNNNKKSLKYGPR